MWPALATLVAILYLFGPPVTGAPTPASALQAALILGVPVVVWAHHSRGPARRVIR